MKKEDRIKIWNKYNKHCAYCGKELEYKDMQVDHFIPQRRAKKGRYKVSIDVIEDEANYMPSCRRCNLYKRANGIETLRRYIEEIPEKLKTVFIYKVALDYNIIEEKPRKIKFYYETFENKDGAS